MTRIYVLVALAGDGFSHLIEVPRESVFSEIEEHARTQGKAVEKALTFIPPSLDAGETLSMWTFGV